VINVKNKSHAVTAEVEAPAAGAEGVIVAQGGAFGGWVLYVRGGRLKYCHNFLGLQRFTVEGDRGIEAGTHQVRMELEYAGGGLGKGATVRLYLDGDRIGEGPVAATVPLIFSGDETTDLGQDTASPVADDYSAAESRFNGAVNWVQLDVDEAAQDIDHLISPEERLRVALARQ
jgi:arylsulfatase